jgi:4-aminobutyrate aminotransferase-like enzyme/Ser/Thr protein kinase RdoA (MazF antagonist)
MDTIYAQQLASSYYNIEATITPLPGEIDKNFKIVDNKGNRYVLKWSAPDTPVERVELEIAIGQHLSDGAFPLAIPESVYTRGGASFVVLENQSILRVQKWVEGAMLEAAQPRTPSLLHQWGKTAGLLSRHLQGFDHPYAHRPFHWNPSSTLESRPLAKYITDPYQKKIAEECWQLFEKHALPVLPSLRKSVNYNDAHEHNLLTDTNHPHPKITGLIDFGDALYTETVNELAIACAYAGMNMRDPVEAMKPVVRAYHEVFPLEEKEIAVLYYLILARLLITVSQAARNAQESPENVYLQVSARPAWELLEKLWNSADSFVHFSFRDACSLPPCTAASSFQQWIENEQPVFYHPMDIKERKTAKLDLSVDSLELGNNSHFEEIKAFNKTITSLLQKQDADIGIGGYLEVRPFYVSDAYQVEGNAGAQWRTVHLGVDVWDAAGAPVYAAYDGRVHSFQDNEGECNYGPTIILEHEYQDGKLFYTLYGHLSRTSLTSLETGQSIQAGQQIATLGAFQENGNWPPHLHFQVMLDMLEMHGDFPGVAYPHELSVWKSICPDPSQLLLMDVLSESPMAIEEILEKRQRHLGSNLSVSYDCPLHIVRGYRQYLYDHTARRYLDTVNNVAHVGHEHPAVVAAGQGQMGVLNTNTRYLHEHIVAFAEALTQTLPEPLSVLFFVNSGSEANELALRMAETYTQSQQMIALEVGYHGNTGACIAVSSYKFDGKGGKGAPARTQAVSMPDTYRGKYRETEYAAKLYAQEVDQAIVELHKRGEQPAGFISESIMSCGGQIVLPDGYLGHVYKSIRQAGGICIADEVQTGLGRVGSHYWAFQLHGVVPDIVTIGKPVGNGHPLGIVATTPAIAEAFANGMEYFNTFGGNPVSCAIGHAVLRVVEEEKLMENALKTGNYLQQSLIGLQKEYPLIGDVRGHGLFLGVELVEDPILKTPAGRKASYLANRMRERGILMSTDGPDGNVLKIKPPLCFQAEHADFLLENLSLVLKDSFLSA